MLAVIEVVTIAVSLFTQPLGPVYVKIYESTPVVFGVTVNPDEVDAPGDQK